MTILYPVAETAEAALHAPRGFAAREREAGQLAGREVEFVTEAVGPAFATREAAVEAYAGRGEGEPWRQLRAVSVPPGAKPRPRAPVKPVFRDGRRWPSPEAQASERTLWRLSVSFWRIAKAGTAGIDTPARRLRRDAAAGRALDPEALEALARQPLRAHAPQHALDIGLFEVRLPEDPSIIVPDE